MCPGTVANGAAVLMCVDESSDPNNCGACQKRCALDVGCVHGTCGVEPSVFVQPAPGCISLKLAYRAANATLYWADLGHSTINSIPAPAGGMVTTLASATTGSVAAPIDPVFDSAGNLYWVNTGSNSIGVLPAGGAPRVLVTGSAIASITMVDPKAQGGVDPLVDGGLGTIGGIPIVNAIALSTDEKSLYVAAGTRFYAVPVAGGGTPVYIGYAEGPEHGVAHALTADATKLYYLTDLSGNVEIMTFAPTWCDPAAAVAETCPPRIAESQGGLLLDTIYLRNGLVYWVNDSNVQAYPVAMAPTGFANTVAQTFTQSNNVPAFALGPTAVYLGEIDTSALTTTGFLEKVPPPGDSGNLAAEVLVRNIPRGMDAQGMPTILMPSSIALDGTNVYFPQGNCSIMKLADSPQ
jgi:sugar lactone lactonase YvrE